MEDRIIEEHKERIYKNMEIYLIIEVIQKLKKLNCCPEDFTKKVYKLIDEEMAKDAKFYPEWLEKLKNMRG